MSAFCCLSRPPFRAAIPDFRPAASGLPVWGSGSFLLEPLYQRSLLGGCSSYHLRAVHLAPFYYRRVPENSRRSRHKPPFLALKKASLLCRSFFFFCRFYKRQVFGERLTRGLFWRRVVAGCPPAPEIAGLAGPALSQQVSAATRWWLDHVTAAPIDTSPVGRLTRSPPCFLCCVSE